MTMAFWRLTFRALCVLCILLFSPALSIVNDGQNAPERTHAERFSPREEKLQLALQRAESRVKSNATEADAWLDLGLAHLRLNQVDAGCIDFRRAATLAPMRAQPQADLAYALWLQGRIDEAFAAARAALALNPNDAYAQRYFGRLMLLRGGNLKQAIEYLEKAVQHDPEMTDVHFDLLMAYRAAGNKPNAWAELRILQTEFAPDYPRLLYVQGLLASDQGVSPVAVSFLHRAVSGNPHLPAAQQALGLTLARMGRWADALEALVPLAKQIPGSFQVSYIYALAPMENRDLARAEGVARSAAINPGSEQLQVLRNQLEARMRTR